MALDLAKYRALFLEEAQEHTAEIGRALLELEKSADSQEAIDTIFRMAHSIKSMAASLGYDSVSEVAHSLEDRMEDIRREGRLRTAEEGALLFSGLEGLEQMIGVVAATGDAPPPMPALLEALARPLDAPGDAEPKKKALSPTREP